jgi:hypothetical protein
MRNTITDQPQPRTITLAELCEALANGAVQAEVEDDMYVIRSRDLLRLSRTRTLKLPAIALVSTHLMQAS